MIHILHTDERKKIDSAITEQAIAIAIVLNHVLRRVDCKTFCTDRKCHRKLVFKTRQNRRSVTRGTRQYRRYFLFSISTEAMLLVILYKEYSSVHGERLLDIAEVAS